MENKIREQEIYRKAHYDFSYWGVFEEDNLSKEDCFVEGAKWADRNQPNPWKHINQELPKNLETIVAHNKIDGSYIVFEYNTKQKDYFLNNFDFWMTLPIIPQRKILKEDHDPYPEE